MSGHPFLDATGPIAIAHRGGAKEAPENSLEAFQCAHALGYRYLETDAQLTSDGVVVAFHDRTIDRVSSESGKIREWSWVDLAEVTIGASARLVTISHLLDEFPDVRFNIDAKSDAVLEPLLAVIGEADAFDRVCLGSFSDNRLSKARRLAGARLCTSLGPAATARLVARSRGIRLPAGEGQAVQAPPSFHGVTVITERFVTQAHSEGLAVHAWTIDDPKQIHDLLDLGVDGIMTDVPSILRDVLQSRGLW